MGLLEEIKNRQQKRVLIVDDEQGNIDILKEFINDAVPCDSAANGDEAVIAFREAMSSEHPYNLIFLDVMMPHKDGIEVVKEIRAIEEESGVSSENGVAIIMVTAHSKFANSAFKYGCDDYIMKPFDFEELAKKMVDKLESRI